MKSKLFLLCLVCSLMACSGSDDQASLSLGEQIVKQNCKVCHAQGINGAPIIGNKKMWESRLSKSEAMLTQNAINGVGLMPAKGGSTELTEDEMSAAVTYMLSQLKP